MFSSVFFNFFLYFKGTTFNCCLGLREYQYNLLLRLSFKGKTHSEYIVANKTMILCYFFKFMSSSGFVDKIGTQD